MPDFHLTINDNSYSMSDGAHLHVDIDPDFTTTITFTDLQSTRPEPRNGVQTHHLDLR